MAAASTAHHGWRLYSGITGLLLCLECGTQTNRFHCLCHPSWATFHLTQAGFMPGLNVFGFGDAAPIGGIEANESAAEPTRALFHQRVIRVAQPSSRTEIGRASCRERVCQYV